MLKFKTQFDERELRFSCPGERYHDERVASIASDGSLTLKVSGKIDTEAVIQSYADSVDINVIISRFQQGELQLLNRKVPQFIDVHGAPQNYAEMLNMVMQSQLDFLKLPLDVRESFDNDYGKWLAAAGSDDWLVKMKMVQPNVESKEVVEDA